MRKSIFALAFSCFCFSAQANESIKYVCTKADAATRIIEVVYASPDAEVPCDVAYTKDGNTQNLWHYDNTLGACAARAAEFADKQRAWGMTCNTNPTEAETPTPPAAPSLN